MEYIFILGRARELARQELIAVLNREEISYQILPSSTDFLRFKSESIINSASLIKILGGTVKITQVFDSIKSLDDEKLGLKIVPLLKKNRKDFGLSYFGQKTLDLTTLSRTIKLRLKADNLRLSYVLPQEGMVLSSVVVSKRNLTEINIIQQEESFLLSQTLEVQDFTSWNLRDYGRPFSNPSKGMLPPKVARMMVNLAITRNQKPTSNFTILDPFCGMGTILAEALMMGYQVIGSDLDQDSVNKAGKNLEWLVDKLKVKSFDKSQDKSSKFKVFKCDATHISEKLDKELVDAIVTEPYLGPLVEIKEGELVLKNKKKLTQESLLNIIIGLDKLYLGSLKDWQKVLKQKGRIVIITPSYKINNQEIFVKKSLDNCEKLGYNLVAGPYKYQRPQTVVIRNIYILEKN